jgi:hypothetical protein
VDDGDDDAAMGSVLTLSSSRGGGAGGRGRIGGGFGGEGMAGTISLGGGGSGDQSTFNLSEQVSGIFMRYRESYMTREMELVTYVCAKSIRDTLALEAPRAHSGSVGHGGDHSDDTDIFGRLKKEVVADQKQRWVLLVLEAPLVERLVQHSTLALQRCDRLSDSPSSIPDNAAHIFLHVCSQVLEHYLQPVFDVALQFLPPLEPKVEPDPFLLQVVGLLGLVADKLHLHYTLFVAPRIAANPNTQLITDARVRELFAKVEGQISACLARLLQSHLKYVARLLHSKQKASDYRPREDDSDAVLDGKPSPACEAVCACVRGLADAVQTCLDGKNLDKFLTVLGLKLHDVLVNHLTRAGGGSGFSISVMGAGLLARDMKEYQRVVGGSGCFHLQPVQDKWSELRQLIDLFFVGPEHLRAVINDSHKLARMAQHDPAYLLSFVEMRADYSDNKKRIVAALNLGAAQSSGFDF